MPISRTIAPSIARSISSAVEPSRLAWEQGGGAPDLAAQILAAYAGVGWVVPDMFLARAEGLDVSLVSGGVATWVNHGTADDATQGTGTARPTWSTTGLNSRPALTFDGGDMLSRAAVDLAAYSAFVQHVVFFDTVTALRLVVERSADASSNDGGNYLGVNGAADSLRVVTRGNAATSVMDSTAETMDSPHVISVTWDQALATNETFIRRDGVDITGSRTANANTSGGFGNHAMFIGARTGVAFPLAGAIAAVITAVGTTAIPLTAVAQVENLLRAQWGL